MRDEKIIFVSLSKGVILNFGFFLKYLFIDFVKIRIICIYNVGGVLRLFLIGSIREGIILEKKVIERKLFDRRVVLIVFLKIRKVFLYNLCKLNK